MKNIEEIKKNLIEVGELYHKNLNMNYEFYNERLKRKIVEYESIFDYLYSVNEREYRFLFIEKVLPYLSKEEISETISYVYIDAEHPESYYEMNREKLIELFKLVDKNLVMNEKERAVYDSLDDEVVVYRGVPGNKEERVKALSWTINKEKARWFASRPTRSETPSALYRAKINKKDIFLFTERRHESEIILNPNKLKEIEKIETFSKEKAKEVADKNHGLFFN